MTTITQYRDIRDELKVTKNISRRGRMFCYLYLYQHSRYGICSKFGDTFVNPGEDAHHEVINRIDQQGHEHGESHKILAIWDVSDYARKFDKNTMRAKIDTAIANKIGLGPTRINSESNVKGGADLYRRDPDWVQCAVQHELDSLNCPRMECGLTEWQYYAVGQTIDYKEAGANTIIADMCARSGKTIYTAASICELGNSVNVICSYVLNSITSFAKDIFKFEQFRNIEFIDTANENWKKMVNSALKNGKQVCAFVSMCGKDDANSTKANKLKYLLGKCKSTNIFVDEADFGAWKQNMIKNTVKPDTFTVLMTGTNIERAATNYKIDGQITVSYIDMLIAKNAN